MDTSLTPHTCNDTVRTPHLQGTTLLPTTAEQLFTPAGHRAPDTPHTCRRYSLALRRKSSSWCGRSVKLRSMACWT